MIAGVYYNLALIGTTHINNMPTLVRGNQFPGYRTPYPTLGSVTVVLSIYGLFTADFVTEMSVDATV